MFFCENVLDVELNIVIFFMLVLIVIFSFLRLGVSVEYWIFVLEGSVWKILFEFVI